MTKISPNRASLLTASALGGALSVVRLAAGLIKNKATVVFIGATGVGLISQANEFWLLMISIGSLMLSGGITTQIKRNTSPENQLLYLRTAWTVQVLMLLTLAAVGFLFSDQLNAVLFKGAGQEVWIFLILLSLPFTVFSSGLLEGLVLALDHYRDYIWLSAVATVLSSAAIIWGIWQFGLQWAFIGWSINGLILLGGYLFIIRRHMALSAIFRFHIHKPALKSLLHHGLAVLTASLVQGLCMLSLRGDILHHLGSAALGLIQVPIAASLYYTPFLTNGLWGHFHPLLSGKATQEERTNELIRNLSWVMFIQFAFALLLHGYGTIFIKLIYSQDFLPAYNYFFEYLLGNGFYFFAFVFGVYFIAVAEARWYLLGLALYYVVWLIFTQSHLHELELLAVARGHLIGASTVFALCGFWLLRQTGLRRCLPLLLHFVLASLTLTAQNYLVTQLNLPLSGYAIPLLYLAVLAPFYLRKRKV